ncbi:MAG: DUF1501 domain-containing protein [Verrucomicrobia bacterium]|nr:DUF1501 domain-containing protein [Verrucomicrobiota bacterium]
MNDTASLNELNRRQFLARAGMGAAALGLAGTSPLAFAAEKKSFIKGKAEHCIMLWLAGGMAHVDTFDPKQLGDPVKKVAGSAYPAIKTAVRDVQVCEHLQRTAGILDRFVLLRTVNHGIIDEHAAATNFVHTGRRPTGTITYPSLGSVTAQQLGSAGSGIPPYVLIGYPNPMRGPGFLGAKYNYVYLTDTEKGPAGLTRPAHVTTMRQSDREVMLEKMRTGYRARHASDKLIGDYDDAIQSGFALASGDFMKAFNLAAEPSSLRQGFGDEFGQRCLLARRLVQSGVRFVEVSFNLNFLNGTGWDTHNQGQKNQHILIQQLDQAIFALITDLEKNKLLDKTLVVVASEFGRPPEFDAGGGRGHWAKAFTIALAGGGLKLGQAIGTTDDLGKLPIEDPISIPDAHATIYSALGINPSKVLRDGDRPVPITDMGEPVKQAFV